MQGLGKRSATILILISIVLTSIAQLLFRFAMKHGDLDSQVGWGFVASIPNTFSESNLLVLLLGVCLYGASMVVWIVALTRYPVSLAYPMLSISYILVYVTATQLAVLNETATPVQTIGVVLIVIGVALLAHDKPLESDDTAE